MIRWKSVAVSTAALALAALAVAAPARAQSSRPPWRSSTSISAAIQHWWSGNWDIGKGVADLIVDGLVEDGSFRVIERKRLDAILAEQNFSNSDRADPSAASVAKIGKALGVKYLMVGSITKFGTEKKDMGVGGGGVRPAGGVGIGKVGTQKGKANVAVTVRMIDSSTGEIMASAKGDGVSSRSGLLLGGGGAGGGGAGGGGFSMGSSDYRDTILGEATEMAVKQVVDEAGGGQEPPVGRPFGYRTRLRSRQRDGSGGRAPVAQRERHAPQHDRLAVHVGRGPGARRRGCAGAARGLDDDRVARTHRAPVAHALDPAEEDQLVLVLRLGQDQDGADLRDRFGQDRRRQRGRAAAVVPQQRLVAADVLDPHDPLVQLELGHPVDQQERIAVRQDAFDGLVVERQRQGHDRHPV